MNLEEIYAMWQEDSVIDQTNLGNASLDIPKLHHKYYRALSGERMLLRKYENEYKRLYAQKYDWCMGHMDQETLRELGWEVQPKKYLRGEAEQVIEADKDIINLNLRIMLQKEKIDVLESIIRVVNNRGFHIKNAIDWMKFSSGQ